MVPHLRRLLLRLGLVLVAPVVTGAPEDWQCGRSGTSWQCGAKSIAQGDADAGAPESAPPPGPNGASARAKAPPAPPTFPAAASKVSGSKSLSSTVQKGSEAPVSPSTAAAPAKQSPRGRLAALQATPVKRVPYQVAPAEAAPTKTGTRPPSPGWTCRSGEEEEGERNWDCALVGADPRGMPHQVDEEGQPQGNWAEADTITREDEQRFQRMNSILPADPWQNACVGRRRPPPLAEFQLSALDRQARDAAPLDIESNYFEMLDSEVANFAGAAKLVKADQKLWADFVTRNVRTNAVNANGNVVYQEKGFAMSGDTGFLDADTSRGVFRNTQFLLPAVPGRGTSRVTHLDSNTLSRYETFTYTSCPPGNRDWMLHASNVKINKETGTGSAQNAWIEFKDVPFFYTPYMTFPVDKRRLSGLLSPSAGLTRYGGFDISAPYYFNLAPDYDYTLTPRYLTKRSVQIKNEFRYLSEASRGRLTADIVPYDIGIDDDNREIDRENAKDVAAGNQLEPIKHLPRTRGQASFLNDTRFGPNLTAHIDANYVSDYRYLVQFGSPLNLIDKRNIISKGHLIYSGSNYWLRAAGIYYQSIDPATIRANAQPYFYLPQLAFSYVDGIGDTGILYETPLQFDAFQTEAGPSSFSFVIPGTRGSRLESIEKTTGQRLSLRPRIYYPFQSASGFITPSFTLVHNEYWLQNPKWWDGFNVNANPRTKSSESLTVPIFSIDSGVFFDRDLEFAGKPMVQTLEPRVFYDYIPYVNQDHIPVFDANIRDFNFYQLFRENRFTGSDRFGDANQITAAVTTRLTDDSTGKEWLRASLGAIVYFRDRDINLSSPESLLPGIAPNAPPLSLSTRNRQETSNVVGEVYAGVTDFWSFQIGGQWNPGENQIDRGLVSLNYNDKQNNLLNIAYRYRVNQYSYTCDRNNLSYQCIDLTDVSFRLPLPVIENWHIIGRWQYSVIDRLTLESFLGVERETCCWRFALLGRRYITNIGSGTGDVQANNGIFFQLEFKGLTTLGNQVDQFLERSVSGYRYRDTF